MMQNGMGFALSPIKRQRKENQAMGKQILVPLKKEDRMEDVLPYINEIVQPGTKVQFLIRYDADFETALRASRAVCEAEVRDPAAFSRIAAMYSWEGQRLAAAAKVLPACKSLREKGAEVAVDVYTGSLRRMVRSYVATGDVHLVVTKSGIGSAIGNLLSGAASVFGLRLSGYRPVRLVHPSTVN
jgi:hypothetical protein